MGILGGLGGGPFDDGSPARSLQRGTRNPPKVWAEAHVDGDVLVVRMRGWRAVWAMQRRLRLPLQVIVNVGHDPDVYQRVSTKLRRSGRARTTMFKLGSQHGSDGWSFWSCGYGRNAVLIETVGIRYRFVIVEVESPAAVVQSVREVTGLSPDLPLYAPPRPQPSLRQTVRARRRGAGRQRQPPAF